jgi:hypothetical protein
MTIHRSFAFMDRYIKRLLSAALALGVDQDQAEKSKATADILSYVWRSGWGAHSTNFAAPDGQ